MAVDDGLEVAEVCTAAAVHKDRTGNVVASVQHTAQIVVVVSGLDNRIVDVGILTVDPRHNVFVALEQSIKIYGNWRCRLLRCLLSGAGGQSFGLTYCPATSL